MNYTEKYHLPQWEETDRIMRTDFNQMCADMEAGLDKTAKDAAAGTAPAAPGGFGISHNSLPLIFVTSTKIKNP